ncbi:glycosyltransferase family 4 protein [Helicobacter sp. MIT 00-7814]|uniref:glycosyltransferase family 4 protein n=1 Tax=unclassified Helicobacter TaxID=2593540 RepID=UPI000E1E60D8|nr:MULTISPECIES: glycosyltransferase family 4 protein [unclassified Helicobacter]RDU55292.1 glycosyltransferase family 4 protein [Helicobacter sp. MIT 99-10781]RDU56130.1 glycosyltransferase family 4 protein [Helicobacter sp. MIT 00-7814]
MKTQKILLTLADISIFGGLERVVVNLANAFVESGYEVEILSFYQGSENLPYALNPRVKLHFFYDKSEKEFLQESKGNFLAHFYKKNLHKFVLSARIAWKYRKNFVIICNDFIFTPFLKFGNARYYKILHLFSAKNSKRNKHFDALIALTDSHKRLLQAEYKNVLCIPNFLPTMPESCPKSRALLENKIVLSIGRMGNDDQKGFLRLIDIWAQMRALIQNLQSPKQKELAQWKLRIVGDGELKNTLESKIQSLCLQECVELKPFTKEIQKEYLNASIYAMASHIEGLPMVLIESQSFGLPCIAFDIQTGPSEIISTQKNGFLLQDNDLQGFAEALLTLMQDKSLRQNFGENARQSVEKNFSKAKILSLWEKLLQS